MHARTVSLQCHISVRDPPRSAHYRPGPSSSAGETKEEAEGISPIQIWQDITASFQKRRGGRRGEQACDWPVSAVATRATKGGRRRRRRRNGGMASWGGQAIREARQPAGLPLPLAREAKEGEGDDGQEEGRKLEARNET